jgi:hypothetical protein
MLEKKKGQKRKVSIWAERVLDLYHAASLATRACEGR